jgi:hypothetical protein
MIIFSFSLVISEFKFFICVDMMAASSRLKTISPDSLETNAIANIGIHSNTHHQKIRIMAS